MAEEKKQGAQEEAEEGTGVEETQGGENQGTGAATGNSNGAGQQSQQQNNNAQQQNKTFTQEQVNRMMTKEKNQGRAAALKELGIDPKDTKAMDMIKAFMASQKTPEQQAAEQAAATAAAQAEAEHRALVAEAKAEAMLAGVQPQFVEDIVTLVINKMSDDNSDLKTLMGEFKTKYPMWFEATAEDADAKRKQVGQKGTGTSVKGAGGSGKGGSGGEETKGLGARLAAQRKASTGKSSYWGGRKK